MVKHREAVIELNREEASLDKRGLLLEAVASTASRQWVEQWRNLLRGQGRPLAGGWPGTLPEARAVAQACFQQEHARNRSAALKSEEINWLAKSTYAKARQQWLSGAAREGLDIEATR